MLWSGKKDIQKNKNISKLYKQIASLVSNLRLESTIRIRGLVRNRFRIMQIDVKCVIVLPATIATLTNAKIPK